MLEAYLMTRTEIL